MTNKLTPGKRKELITLALVFGGVLLISALAVYFIAGSPRRATVAPTEAAQPIDQARRDAVETRSPAPPPNAESDNFVDRMFGTKSSESHVDSTRWAESIGTISLRLLLAALLGAALAFRPRRAIFGFKRNPYVSQTQILLAIVAAALMIIVGDNAARAFGIFAAVSLVRFRTNIRDPKEITVLLISLALGLASGVGRWDLALILATFALLVLSLLEWREPKVVFRALEVKVVTRDIVSTQQSLTRIFKDHAFDFELRTIDRGSREDSPGTLLYSVDVSPIASTDQLSEELLAVEERNVEAIEWDQKKSNSYLYQ